MFRTVPLSRPSRDGGKVQISVSANLTLASQMWNQALLDGEPFHGPTAARVSSRRDYAPPMELTPRLENETLKPTVIALSNKAASLRVQSLTYLRNVTSTSATTAGLLELCGLLPRLKILAAGRLVATKPSNFEFQRYTATGSLSYITDISLGLNLLLLPPSIFELFQFLRCFPQLQRLDFIISDIQHDSMTTASDVYFRLAQEHMQVVFRPIDLSHLQLTTFRANRALPGFEMLLAASSATLSELSVAFQDQDIHWLSPFIAMLGRSAWTALRTLQLWWKESRQQPSPLLNRLIQALPHLREFKYSGPTFDVNQSTSQPTVLGGIAASLQAPLRLLSIHAIDRPLAPDRADHLALGIAHLLRTEPSWSRLQVLQIEGWCRDGKGLRDGTNTASRTDLVETCRARRICLEW